MKTIIRIPGYDAVWRYDQIAGLELVESTVSVFFIGTNLTEEVRKDYEYDDEDEAAKAFAELIKDWKLAIQS